MVVSVGVALNKDWSVTGLRWHAGCLHLADQECSSMGVCVVSPLWVLLQREGPVGVRLLCSNGSCKLLRANAPLVQRASN